MSINISRLKLVEKLIHIDGKPISFDDYPMHKAVYQGGYSDILLKCGRQVGKSTTAGNFILAESIGKWHFSTIYLNPYKDQTSRFSNTRIKKIISFSPKLIPFFDHSMKKSVFHKEFLNGSELYMSYAQMDADRIRGIPADRAVFDEVQDMDFQAVMPVVLECLSNSDYGYKMYLGTPKTTENTIEYLWGQSTKTEWCVKCERCNTWSFFETIESIGPRGPLCRNKRCQETVNPRYGKWINMQPGATIQGFHIPQVILPRNYDKPERWWKNVYSKLSNPAYGDVTILNECLGISASRGAKMISLNELIDMTKNGPKITIQPVRDNPNILRRIAGVDWSGGGITGISRTALYIWGLQKDGKLVTEWFKIYPNMNPIDTIQDIGKYINYMRVAMTVGDAGEGHTANNLLRQYIGAEKLIPVQWGSQALPMKWNGVDRYICDKTTVFDNFIIFMKYGGVILPQLPEAQIIIDDILNEYEDISMTGKKLWKCTGGKSDDLLHAQIFGWLAHKITSGDINFIPKN